MENTSFKIIFWPMLKNFANKGAKCTIAIVPEVPGFQNLDKLEWKDNGLVEYTIPLTCKIYIKKENDSAAGDIEKTYHSCVDLLHGYSLSNMNLASSDLTRIISENCIHSKISSNIERCDIVLNRNKIHNTKKKDKIISELVHRTESIQKLNVEEINHSHSTIDRSNQIDIRRESVLTVKKVSETINTKNSAMLTKTNEIEENDPKRDASNTKSSKQRLTLTPMLSIDTYGTEPLNQDEQKKVSGCGKTVSENNFFEEFVQCLSGCGNNCDPIMKVDNNKYFEYIALDKAGNIHQPLSNSSYHHKGRVIEKNDSDSINPAKVYVNQKYQTIKHTALNDIIYETQNYDDLQVIDTNSYNIISNPNNYSQSRFIELQNTVVTLQGNDCENDQKVSQNSSCVKVISSRVKSKDKDSFAIDTMKSIKPQINHKFRGKNKHRPENLELNRHVSDMIITNKSRNDYLKTECAANTFFSDKLSRWISYNARVSQFDKYLQKEIYPLVTELNDIKTRCISYGLFTSDMVPYLAYNKCKSLPIAQGENVMIGNQTVPKFEKEINKHQVTQLSHETSLNPQSKITEFQTRKPNRMVYSILFDD